MLIFQSIASGSNGNCSVLQIGNDTILIDAGISRKRTIQGLNELSIDPTEISAVLITHAHSDHISGLPVLMDNLPNARVVATKGTLKELSKLNHLDPRYSKFLETGISIDYGKYTKINNLVINCFLTLHDIQGSACFGIYHKKKNIKLGYATDTSTVSSSFRNYLAESDIIFLESNHDIELLKKSRRPYWLKQRIRKTHLSNSEFIDIIKSAVNEKTKCVYMGHLSGECNKLDIVYDQMYNFSNKSEFKFNWVIASRYDKSACIDYNKQTGKQIITNGISNLTGKSANQGLNEYFI